MSQYFTIYHSTLLERWNFAKLVLDGIQRKSTSLFQFSNTWQRWFCILPPSDIHSSPSASIASNASSRVGGYTSFTNSNGVFLCFLGTSWIWPRPVTLQTGQWTSSLQSAALWPSFPQLRQSLLLSTPLHSLCQWPDFQHLKQAFFPPASCWFLHRSNPPWFWQAWRPLCRLPPQWSALIPGPLRTTKLKHLRLNLWKFVEIKKGASSYSCSLQLHEMAAASSSTVQLLDSSTRMPGFLRLSPSMGFFGSNLDNI